MSEISEKDKMIGSCYTEILRCEHNTNFERAITQCNRLLSEDPKDCTVLHSKVVCLIHLSKFAEALKFINSNAPATSELNFEKAYCLYRLNNNMEALDVLEKADQDDVRIMELKAQVFYRLEKYNEANDVYRQLGKLLFDDYKAERKTNLAAVKSFIKDSDANVGTGEDTHELGFNKANYFINFEAESKAEEILSECEKRALALLEDEGAADDEIAREVAHIRVQTGFVRQQMGRSKDALQRYNQALRLKLDDMALVAVASNNAVVINKDQNLFDSKKKMRAVSADSVTSKVPASSRKHIFMNNAILAHYTHQDDVCEHWCKRALREWPELAVPVHKLRAMALVNNGRLAEAVELLRGASVANPDDALQLQLTSLHLLLMQGDKEKACILIEGLGSSSYRPAIIGALITLYMSMDKEDVALKVFEDAIEWYQSRKDVTSTDLTLLWRQAAEFHLRNGRPRVAATSLEQLLETNPEDDRALAQLVVALGQCLVKDEGGAAGVGAAGVGAVGLGAAGGGAAGGGAKPKVKVAASSAGDGWDKEKLHAQLIQASKRLSECMAQVAATKRGGEPRPRPASAEGGLTPDAVAGLERTRKAREREQLENTSWLTAKKSGTSGAAGAAAAPGSTSGSTTSKDGSPGGTTPDKKEREKKVRKRKGKLPQNYVAGATPDPERWLPKYERTGFRKKRDRRTKEVMKGSQGTTSGQSEQFDFTKVAEAQQLLQQQLEDSPSTDSPTPGRPQHQQRKGANQKKKNKRR